MNLRQRRWAGLFEGDELLPIFCRSTAPFTTGLGNEHPLENGFAFLWPYGIPYLPGSGVKGVLRQAARELATCEWGDAKGWDEEKTWRVKVGKETITLGLIDLLFGLESKDHQKEHFRGPLTFWDVIPDIKGGRLMVEIMTPHQTHYYQNGEPPHDSGWPVPIYFLTVPPESGFQFHIVCDTARLRHVAPDLLEESDGKPRWKVLMETAFTHAFEWLGFGAKTAVGYGAMKRMESQHLREEVHKEAERTEREEELARMDPLQREVEEIDSVGNAIRALEQGRWQGEEQHRAARYIKIRMEREGSWKESTNARRPGKDRKYQHTLTVLEYLGEPDR